MFELDAMGQPVAVEDLDPAGLLVVLEQRKLGALSLIHISEPTRPLYI